MTVSKFALPTAVDGDLSVLARIAAAFAPHQSEPPAFTVTVDGGPRFDGSILTELAPQTTQVVTAPTANPRIDRIVLNRITGIVAVVQGVENQTPTPPSIPSDSTPIAHYYLSPTSTAITNDVIVDERVSVSIGNQASPGGLLNIQKLTSSGTYTPTPGTLSVIVEVLGGGGSGGGCGAPDSGRGAAGGGGGAGAYAKGRFTGGFAGVAVTIGAGGAATAAGVVNGTAGGQSSFGTLISAPGGRPGPAGPVEIPANATARSGVTLVPVGGNIVDAQGQTGGLGIVLSPTEIAGGTGGNSQFAAGSVGSFNTNGIASGGFGSGGGGGSSATGNPARSGGAGGPGVIIVHEYA